MLLWSVLKIIFFILAAVAVVFGIVFLTEASDVVVIEALGREFVLTPIVAVIGLMVALAALYLLLRLIGLLAAVVRFLNGDETAISRYFNRRRERRGYQALSEGMLALASGEGRLAIRKAERAEGYLNRPELTNLLVAQAAEMAGDQAKATATYKKLLSNDRTRFVAIRGLMRQKLEAGDTDTALQLAQKAFSIRPQHVEVQDTLLRLQSSDEDWKGARRTLAAKLKSASIPRDVHKRRDAVLALAQARDELAEGKIDAARKNAYDANRLSPDLIPAAVMAARMAIDENKPRVATRVIRKAWDATPHPDLAAAFAEIEPEETPAARLKRFRVLLSRHPEDLENHLLAAELNIAAEDYAAARKALGDLAESRPTARSLTIMAAIERGEGAEERVVHGWLAKAVTASRGPQWICEVCGQVYAEWVPVCDQCGGFDTLVWKEAPQSEAALSGAAQMLPLIVGALEDQSQEDPEPEAESEAEISAAEEAAAPEEEDTNVIQIAPDYAPEPEVDEDVASETDGADQDEESSSTPSAQTSAN